VRRRVCDERLYIAAGFAIPIVGWLLAVAMVWLFKI